MMMKLLLTVALVIALVVDARAYADVPKVQPGSRDNTQTYSDPNGIGIIKSALNAGIMESFMVLGGATKIYYCDGHVWAQFYGSPIWVNVTKDLHWRPYSMEFERKFNRQTGPRYAWVPRLQEQSAIYYPGNDHFLNADGIAKTNGSNQNWQFVGYSAWSESLDLPVGSNILMANADPALEDKWEFFSNNTWQVLSNQVAKTLQPYATQSWLSRPQDVAVQLFLGPASESKWQLRGYCVLGDASPQLLQKLNGVFQKLAPNASFLDYAPLTPKQFFGDQLVLPGPGTQPPPDSQSPGDQKPPSNDKDKGRDKKTPPPSDSSDKGRDKTKTPPPSDSTDKGRDKSTTPPSESTDKGREKSPQPETGSGDKHQSDPSQQWRQEKQEAPGPKWRDKEKPAPNDPKWREN